MPLFVIDQVLKLVELRKKSLFLFADISQLSNTWLDLNHDAADLFRYECTSSRLTSLPGFTEVDHERVDSSVVCPVRNGLCSAPAGLAATYVNAIGRQGEIDISIFANKHARRHSVGSNLTRGMSHVTSTEGYVTTREMN